MPRVLTPPVVLVLRAALLAVALVVVLGYRIGPVLFSLSATHGMHVGDLLAVPPALGAVLPRRRRVVIDRRVGVKTPISPNPGRRASDRA